MESGSRMHLKRTSVWRRLRRNVCFYCWMEMALLEGCQDMEHVKTVLDRSEQYIEKLAENYSASYLVVSTIDVRPEHIGAGDASDLAQASGAYWDTLLTGLAERQKNIHRFELRRLIEDYGRKQFYSAKFWYMGSIPYDMKALHLLAEEMPHVMARLVRVPKKVLVLDLDNTLWGGVIGEDGPEGIVLDSAHRGSYLSGYPETDQKDAAAGSAFGYRVQE